MDNTAEATKVNIEMESTPLKPDQSTYAVGIPVDNVVVGAPVDNAPVNAVPKTAAPSETAKFTYHTVPYFFEEKHIPVA